MHKKTPIFFATDNNYIFITCVAILSLWDNCEDKEQEIIILSTNKLTEAGEECLEKLRRLCKEADIKYYAIDEKHLEGASIGIQYISTATYLRLLIPEFFPQYDKCVYLDSDLLVVGDILLLQNIDISDYLCAGVHDEEFMLSSAKHTKAIQMNDLRLYINAGVLIMNLKKLRENDVVTQFKNLMKNRYPLQDQDVINIACENKVCLIEERYNCFSRSSMYPGNMVILHFSGGPDVHPWENMKAKGYNLWWDEAEKLADCEMYQSLRLKCGELNDRYDIIGKLNRYQSKRIYIWGFTEKTGYLSEYLKNKGIKNITAFIDSDTEKQKRQYKGIDVISFQNADLCGAVVINTVHKHREEVNSLIKGHEIQDITVIQYYEKTRFYYRALRNEYFEQELNEMLALSYGIIR